MEVVGIRRSCLVRQVNEAVRIMIYEAGCVMNSKSKFHQAPLVRIVPPSGLLEEQGTWAEPAPSSALGRGRRQGGGPVRRGGVEEEGQVDHPTASSYLFKFSFLTFNPPKSKPLS